MNTKDYTHFIEYFRHVDYWTSQPHRTEIMPIEEIKSTKGPLENFKTICVWLIKEKPKQ